MTEAQKLLMRPLRAGLHLAASPQRRRFHLWQAARASQGLVRDRQRPLKPCFRGPRMERETGIEPATNSLEGCDSTTELLPRKQPLAASFQLVLARFGRIGPTRYRTG